MAIGGAAAPDDTGGPTPADEAAVGDAAGPTGAAPGAASTAPTGSPRHRWRVRGGLVTAVTVLSLVAGMGLTVFGLGAADHAVASFDAASWLWSRSRGEVARVNGVTGRVDTRVAVPGARGHTMQVSQTDRFLLVRDVATGQVGSLDLTSLQLGHTTPSTAGLGVSVALHDDTAFVVDAVQGVVRQLDPGTLAPVGEPVRFPPGITGGTFDGAGRLWIAVPSEGTVSAVTPAPLPSDAPDGTAGDGLSPRLVRTHPVAAASHDLVVSALDDGVAVLDRTTDTLTVLRGDAQRTVTLPLDGPGTLPARTSGDAIAVTVPDSRRVHVVTGEQVSAFEVPGSGGQLRPAVGWAGLFYCADEQTGTVHVLDATGRPAERIEVPDARGPLELEVRENHLFVNAPHTATARVVDDRHRVRVVDKYADGVLGGDPPPAPPPPPPPPPSKPVAGKPGPPRAVTATAGDGRARVSWRPAAANGAPITRYVVEGAGRSFRVGAGQRSLDVTELTNGETYRFTVHAINAEGAGPKRASNPVVPTSEVPDPPASVTAEARPDGTVAVTWPAADGLGLDIERYAVTAVTEGAGAPVGTATGTELVIKAGELEYGTQYAFTVVSVNERGGASEPSPVSDTVVPFTVPGRPEAVAAATVAEQRGAVHVTWTPGAENGRPVTGYVVTAGEQRVEVADGTSATLTGFGDGENVAVQVYAVNEAGDGEPAGATARTVAPPKVTVTGGSATYDSVTVTFTVDAGGGQATCSLATPGRPAVTGACSSLRLTGLDPGTSYPLTVTARNAAGDGTAQRNQATSALFGVATCKNGQNGDTATYCDADVPGRNGNEIFSVPRQDNNRQVGWAKPGTRLKALCRRQGEEVYAYIYNSHKRSTWWVQVEYSGRNFIPWAWLNLENGDKLDALPTC